MWLGSQSSLDGSVYTVKYEVQVVRECFVHTFYECRVETHGLSVRFEAYGLSSGLMKKS